MMNSTLNGFGFNTINPSFVNGFGGFVPGLNNFVPGFNGQFPAPFGWNNQFNGQSPIGLGWNGSISGLGGWNTPVSSVNPFGMINPSFVGGWNGLSPVGFNGLNTTSLFNTPFNTWNGFSGQSPIGLGWNGQFNSFGGVTPFGGFLPFVSPVNTFPGFVPGYTPSFNQGFVNTVNPTINGGPISGISNGPINTGNLYGQNTTVPSNGYNTPYTNSVPYSPFGVHTSATCAHAA